MLERNLHYCWYNSVISYTDCLYFEWATLPLWFQDLQIFPSFPQITRKTFDHFTTIFTLMIYYSLISTSFNAMQWELPWRNSPAGPGLSSLSTLNGHTQTHHSRYAETLYLTTRITQQWHPFPGSIQTHNLSKRAAADPRLGRRNHCNRCELETASLNT